MAIQDDWTINYGAETVSHTSGTTVYSALAFFQWLAAEFANSTQMDDDYAFVSDTPTVYRWVNGWAFGTPATDYQFLSGGGVESSDGNELWANLYSIGSQEEGTKLYIIQNSTEITPWWGTSNIDILVNVRTGGSLIDSGNVLVMARETDYSYDHNTVDLSGGGRNPVGINNAPDLNYTNTGDEYLDVDDVTGFVKGSYAEGGTSGATGRINYVDVTNDRLYLVMIEGTFQTTETINETTGRGGSTTGDTATNHASNATVEAVAAYSTDVTLSAFGTYGNDLNNGNGSVNYDVEITASGGADVLEVFQYLKYITRSGSVVAIDGDDGQEYLSANLGVYTDVKAAPFGTFAGGTFFGARGVWVEGTPSASYQFVDAAGAQQIPPNLKNASIAHASLVGHKILIAERSGAAIIKNQYAVSGAHSAGDTTLTLDGSVNSNKAPQSGVVRINDERYWYASFSGAVLTLDSQTALAADATGGSSTVLVDAGATFQAWGVQPGMTVRNVTQAEFVRVVSVDSETQITTEALGAGDWNSDSYEVNVLEAQAGAEDVYIPLLDVLADATAEISANLIYSADFDVKVNLRKYGTKPFTQDTAFGSTGLSVTPVVASDPQAV